MRGCENCGISTAGLVAVPDTAAHSIGDELERVRLEHRATRIGIVVAELRRLAASRAADGKVPAPLRHAIAGFTQELDAIAQRLGDLPGAHATARRVPVRAARRAA